MADVTQAEIEQSGILQYQGDQPSRCVDVHAYAPAQGRRTAEQAAHDVIVGARMLESGPGARPFDIDWAEQIVIQCKEQGVPVFLKQLGAAPVRSFRRS